MQPAPGAAPPPPGMQLMEQVFFGQIRASAVFAAAKLGVADALAKGPRTSDEVAAALQTHPRSTYRLLRALAGIGLLEERPGRRFALTPVGETLRSDVPGSLRAMAVMGGEKFRMLPWLDLVHSLQTGKPAFEKVFGEPVFAWVPKHPEEAAIFNESMRSLSGQQIEAVLRAYDFAGIRTLVDVAGGTGALLAAILQKHPGMAGTVFELPQAAEGARRTFAQQGLAGRAQAVSGDMFQGPLPPADAILLKHIVHDWDDERCVALLRQCRKALGPQGKLLLVEAVLPPPGAPAPPYGALLDLEMLVLPGGQERTEEEFRALLDRAGFKLARVVPTPAPVSVLEAVPA